VRERIESGTRPGFWEIMRAVFSRRRPVAVGVVFALILLALWIAPYPRNAYVVAEEVTRQCFEGHTRCALSGFLSEHVFTHDPADLGRILSVRTGRNVSVPDLSEAGYTLVEGHVCSVCGEPAIHIYYDDPEGERISLFRISGIEERGALGEKLDLDVEAYVPPRKCWKDQEERGMHVLIWRSESGCVSVVLGHESQEEIEEMVHSCSASRPAQSL
jgi:anti-sigma factor RsiW